jgi:RND family efflux transporter MFP subunit
MIAWFKVNNIANVTHYSSLLLYFITMAVFSQNMPPANVHVIPAKVQALAPISWLSGVIKSQHDAEIAAEVTGRLVQIADLGADLRQGQVLAKLNDSTLRIKQQELTAKLLNALARLKFQQTELERKNELVAQNLASKTDLDDNQLKFDLAQGDVAIAKAQLAQNSEQISFTTLTAPFNGLVVQQLSQLGELITTGSPIVRFVQTDQVQASVFAPIESYQYLRLGELLNISSVLGKGSAKIVALVPVADQRSHLMEIRLDMSAFSWPIGLAIQVAVAQTKAESVLSVPRDALVLRRSGTSIFLIDAKHIAQEVTVTVGIGNGEWVEVVGQVQAGDLIVVRGAERLRTGQNVQLKTDNLNLVSGR